MLINQCFINLFLDFESKEEKKKCLYFKYNKLKDDGNNKQNNKLKGENVAIG